MSCPPLLIALFNGGASRRFGRDKSLVQLDDRPLLESLIAVALTVSPTVVIVGRRPPFDITVPVIIDAVPDSGPLAALVATFAYAPDHAVLAIPCDLPRVTAAHLGRLSAALAPGHDGRVPITGDRLTSIPAYYLPSAAAAFSAVQTTGRRALRLALPELRLDTLSAAQLAADGLDPDGLTDFDSPAELAALRPH